MKTYQDEKTFVEQFSTDVKTESNFEVNGKQFAATYVGKNSGMQAVYSVTIDSNTKQMNITQLKKRLGVTYTREQNRTGETKTVTKFIEKTEAELLRTVTNEYERYKKAFETVLNFAAKHCASYPADCNFNLVQFTDGYSIVNPFDNDKDTIIQYLTDEYIEEQERKRQEQLAKEQERLQEREKIHEEIAKALANGNYKLVATLSKQLA